MKTSDKVRQLEERAEALDKALIASEKECETLRKITMMPIFGYCPCCGEKHVSGKTRIPEVCNVCWRKWNP